jgi:hypothetical protein
VDVNVNRGISDTRRSAAPPMRKSRCADVDTAIQRGGPVAAQRTVPEASKVNLTSIIAGMVSEYR